MKIHLSTILSADVLILDMDGVIVDTEPLHLESFRRYLSDLKVEFSENFIREFIGFSVEENLNAINQTYLKERAIPIPEAVKRRDSYFIGLVEQTPLQPAAGLREIILLSDRYAFPLALASSSVNEHIRIILANLSRQMMLSSQLSEVFEAVTGGDEVEQKKPAPDIYRLTTEKLNVTPSRCVAVEDSYAGILSAKNAGLSVIGLRNPFIKEEHLYEADAVIDSLKDLASAISSE